MGASVWVGLLSVRVVRPLVAGMTTVPRVLLLMIQEEVIQVVVVVVVVVVVLASPPPMLLTRCRLSHELSVALFQPQCD